MKKLHKKGMKSLSNTLKILTNFKLNKKEEIFLYLKLLHPLKGGGLEVKDPQGELNHLMMNLNRWEIFLMGCP